MGFRSLHRRLQRLEARTGSWSEQRQRRPQLSIREHLLADDPVRLVKLVQAISEVDTSGFPCSAHFAHQRVLASVLDEEPNGLRAAVRMMRDEGLLKNDCSWCQTKEEDCE